MLNLTDKGELNWCTDILLIPQERLEIYFKQLIKEENKMFRYVKA